MTAKMKRSWIEHWIEEHSVKPDEDVRFMSQRECLSHERQLQDLANAMNEAHEAFQAGQQMSKDMAIHCGRLMLDTKEMVGHGGWGEWLEKNFNGSSRSAQRYMRLTKAVYTDKIIDPKDFDSIHEMEKALAAPAAAPEEVAPEYPPFEEETENEEYDFGDDEEEDGAEEEPAPKKSRSRRDMKSTAFTKVDEWIREVPGKERDRIRELRNYLDVYEEALNAKDAPPQRGPRDNGADVGKSDLRGRSVGGPKDVVARLAPEMMEKAS